KREPHWLPTCGLPRSFREHTFRNLYAVHLLHYHVTRRTGSLNHECAANTRRPRESRESSSERQRRSHQHALESMESQPTVRRSSAANVGLVSVIIPTFNRAPIVGDAIESVLRQRYSHVEIIVVDDGSTDDTRAFVTQFGATVRYVYQENAGVSAARNAGLRLATGELIAFLDSDDSWVPWKIEAEVAALRVHPAAVVAWTDMSAVDADGAVVHERFLR